MKVKSSAVVVKEFLGGSEVTLAEFKEFWDASSKEDKADFAKTAADALGYIKDEDGKFQKA